MIKTAFIAFTLLGALRAQASGLLAEGPWSQAMGGAHAALGTEASDIAANPAGLVLHDEFLVEAQGAWLFDGSQDLAELTALSPAQASLLAFGLSVQTLWTPQTGNSGQVYAGSLGIPLGESGDTGLGLSLKYLDQDYGDPATALSFDLGFLQRLHFGAQTVLDLGLSILDVDTVLQHQSGLQERLPQVVKLATGLELGHGLDLAWDNDFSNDGITQQYTLHLGVEQRFWLEHLAARLGYISVSTLGSTDPFGGAGSRLTAGLGFRWQDLSLDYAYLPSSGGVGASHRLGLSMGFGPVAKRAVLTDATTPAGMQPLSISAALSGDGLAYLVWDDASARPDTSYVILSSFRPDQFFTRVASTGGGQRSLELRGLKNGALAYFKVVAMDASGQPIDASASPAVKIFPQAAPPSQAAFLAGAAQALAQGDLPRAQEWVDKALQVDPFQADAVLLARRLKRLGVEDKK